MFTTLTKSTLLALLLAPLSTSQLTTSIRLPSPYQDNTHIAFLASLVGVSSSTTTLALHFDNQTNLRSAGYLIDHAPNTMTFSANAFAAVSTLPATLSTPAATVTYGCAFSAPTSAGGTCSFVSDGGDVKSKACAGYGAGKSAPAWCADGEEVPEEERKHAYGVEPQDVATYQVVITAGLEKLSATAGPSVEAKRPVATGAVTLQRGQNVVPLATATGSAPVEATGGAVAGRPAMVGLGVGVLAAMLM